MEPVLSDVDVEGTASAPARAASSEAVTDTYTYDAFDLILE